MTTPPDSLPVLIGLPYSPWSERARWALELRRIPYRSQRYQPITGELELRRLTGRWRGAVTVPLLVAGKVVLADSYDIARWADERGEGQRLFPEGREREVATWNALSERGLAAGRALSLTRMLADREALLEMVPRGLRGVPAIASRIAAVGVARTLRKYRRDHDPRTDLEVVLDEVRAALGKHEGDEPQALLGTFSYADMAIAQVLTFVSPPSTGLRIAPASRRTFRDAALIEQYADLVSWRDALYARWRS